MKNYYREIIFGIFIFAVIGNIIIFISSMKLSTEIHTFEQKTFVLKQENIQLEKEMADTESFLHTKEYQTKWGFARATKPIYVSDLPIALNTKR
ncbi:MAG: hypothetical protein NTZ55_01190 [Candidatus Roizmanbacteria bacterium]|nr:hypothetical protein [Candidatus Roizmanbacteria bacterium]